MQEGFKLPFLASLVFMGLLGGSLHGQSSAVNGPILGFIPDERVTGIRPIIGIPGASTLADGLQLEMAVRGVVISPKQDYAIAARSEDGQAIVIDLRSEAPRISAITGVQAGPDIISISPSGSVAAVYGNETKTLQLIGHLPEAPQVVHEFNASHLAGRGTSLAVSDDASVALVRFVDDDSVSLWVLDSAGASWPVAVDQPSAFAFFPNTTDVIVADNATQSVFLVLTIRGAAARVPLTSAADGMKAFLAVSASEDGRRVFAADADGNIGVVDIQTRQSVLLSCQCRPTGLYRLRGRSVFRLNEVSRQPAMVLDASSDEPRILVIPPSVSVEGEAQ
jgi:hypothetical protein